MLSPAELLRCLRHQQESDLRFRQVTTLIFVTAPPCTRYRRDEFERWIEFCQNQVVPRAFVGRVHRDRWLIVCPSSTSDSLTCSLDRLQAEWHTKARVYRLNRFQSLTDQLRELSVLPNEADSGGRYWPRQIGAMAVRSTATFSAAIALVLCLPLLLLIALTIKVTSPGPVLLVHRQIGRNGRVYRAYRFRAHLAEAEPAGLAQQVDQKAAQPIYSSVGPFLRETGLVHLPGLWNVMRGEIGTARAVSSPMTSSN